jgi:predicted AAA+ superfamily ATPase
VYIHRNLEAVILRTSQAFPVILLTGPRQVGKTTLLKRLSEDSRKYVTLDNPLLRDLAENDPAVFLQRYSPPVIIDEIQYAPALLPYIKMHVDEHKSKGDFWLTGSQMFHMMKGIGESLAGRVGIIQMLGLANSELMNYPGVPYQTDMQSLNEKMKRARPQDLIAIFQRIFKGSMPALYENEQDTEMFYSSYVSTYLQRDVRDLTQVGDELAFMRFMTSCAARTSQMVNYADMAKDIGISPPTAKQWLSILITSGIVALVEPYSSNTLTRIIKSPNLYFLDTGLCAYLTRWSNAETLEVSSMSGAFFETYVVSEIIKSYYNAGKRAPICYYRDTDKREIDLILEKDDMLFPIEIKKSGNPKRDAIRHFPLLTQTGKQIGPGNVICLCNDIIPIDRNNHFVPVWLI